MATVKQNPPTQVAQPNLPKENNTLLIAIVVAVLTALIVGGGIFYWKSLEVRDLKSQNTTSSERINSLSLEVENLSLEVEKLRGRGMYQFINYTQITKWWRKILHWLTNTNCLGKSGYTTIFYRPHPK